SPPCRSAGTDFATGIHRPTDTHLPTTPTAGPRHHIRPRRTGSTGRAFSAEWAGHLRRPFAAVLGVIACPDKLGVSAFSETVGPMLRRLDTAGLARCSSAGIACAGTTRVPRERTLPAF